MGYTFSTIEIVLGHIGLVCVLGSVITILIMMFSEPPR